MNREYHKQYSHELGRDMESLVYGHAGQPILVFPTSMGRFFEYEDAGMIRALAGNWKRARSRSSAWTASTARVGTTKARIRERGSGGMCSMSAMCSTSFLAYLKWKNWAPQIAVTGCSFGGYHALNFSMRHPDLVSACVTMSGSFDIRSFLDGYYDDNVYFNNPPDYLSNMSDEWFLSRYRQMKIVLGSSDWDMCLDANVKMAAILDGKGIPHWLDIYGDNSKHDWPLWQRMAGKYF